MKTIASLVRCGLAAAILVGIGLGHSAANAEEANKAELDAVRQALTKYEDPYVAVRDLYLSTVACVHYTGEKIEGHMDYPKGAMGIHFVMLPLEDRPIR